MALSHITGDPTNSTLAGTNTESFILTTPDDAANPQNILIIAASGTAGNTNGANVSLTPGTGSGSGTDGHVQFDGEANATNHKIINLAAGKDSTDAVNVSQLPIASTRAVGGSDFSDILASDFSTTGAFNAVAFTSTSAGNINLPSLALVAEGAMIQITQSGTGAVEGNFIAQGGDALLYTNNKPTIVSGIAVANAAIVWLSKTNGQWFLNNGFTAIASINATIPLSGPISGVDCNAQFMLIPTAYGNNLVSILFSGITTTGNNTSGPITFPAASIPDPYLPVHSSADYFSFVVPGGGMDNDEQVDVMLTLFNDGSGQITRVIGTADITSRVVSSDYNASFSANTGNTGILDLNILYQNGQFIGVGTDKIKKIPQIKFKEFFAKYGRPK